MSGKWIGCVLMLALLPVFVDTVLCGEPAAGDLFVAPNGKDTWSGQFAEPKADGSDGPLASLAGARDAVRRRKSAGPPKGPIRVLMRGGTYRIAGPVVFTAEDSGTKDAPITYAAYPGERPVVSGGLPITGWKKGDGPLWTTVVPAVKRGRWHFRQLFVDGRRCTPARIPNHDVFQPVGPLQPLKDRNAARRDPKTRLGFFYRGDDLKPWSNLDDVILVHYHSWTTSRHHIRRLDTDAGAVHFVNPSGWPIYWWGDRERYYVECVRQGLDVPGEWYLSGKTGELTYYPRPGEDMATAEAIAPRAEELLRLQRDAASGKPVEHLRFEGLSFQHTAWTMPREGTVDGQAAAFLKTAAVFAEGARNCVFQGCEIARTGGYGLWLTGGCKDNRLVQCEVHDLGAGGVRLGETGLPEQKELQAERNEISNCFIHNGGNVFHAGVGVWIGRSSHNRVLHNEICDFFYTGVSVGWSWGYAPSTAHHNLIQYNHIHHLGWRQLSDMGGIYCLGISPGTRLRYNLIHDVMSYPTGYGGWGLYTDEGSTGILLENNVVYRTKDGGFHQHYGRDNIVRNNVLAFSCGRGQIVRSRQEPHKSFSFERNIVYYTQPPLMGSRWGGQGGFELDYNLYFDATGRPPEFPGGLTLKQWQAKGHDVHSIAADPKFVDPARYDFRLRPDSPAIKLGFQPIDTSTIGLTGPAEWVELPKKVRRPAFVMPWEE